MKRTAKAPPPAVPDAGPVRLFKVLTDDGRSINQRQYAWSLPHPDAHGAMLPGDWHEETPVRVGVRGLHVTPCPLGYGGSYGVTYEVECEGVVGDPATDDQVVAARVRLLHTVPFREAEDVSKVWEARMEAVRRQERVEAEKAEQKERLDTARVSAIAKTKDIAASRAAGVDSPGLLAFKTLVELTPAESWRDVNSSRYDALVYIVSWLRLDPDDVGTIHRDFRGSFWFGENGAENLYTLAIESGNNSACVAMEKFLGRKPWWYAGRGKRERLHVGSTLLLDDAWHTITSFRDDYLNAKREQGAKVYRITREMLSPKTKETVAHGP